ncbi:MAG: DUF1211 domain-containing protein [Proteobacteria bacterium]|nr:DUF1211 domain-containing protein [Pseudomonadota bacterium]
MTTTYNRIAGQNLDRLAALSDGVFAVAMTLLVLDLRTPAAAAIHSEGQLWAAIQHIAPKLLTYLMSFLTLGIFWVGQQTHHSFLSRSDRAYSWINIVFLMLICLVPFSTALLSEFIDYRLALVLYWLNILAIGLALAAASYRARNFGLVKKDMPPDFESAVMRRIVGGQVLYAFGAALCVFSPYWSIGFIVAVQLMFAIGPRFKPFSWI